MAVYFIQAGVDGPVKIGFSNTPERRIASLRTGCPDTLYVRAILEGAKADEEQWHERLSPHRVRGEWFEQEPVVRRLEEDSGLMMPRSLPGLEWPGTLDMCERCLELCWPTDVQRHSKRAVALYQCECGYQWPTAWAMAFATGEWGLA